MLPVSKNVSLLYDCYRYYPDTAKNYTDYKFTVELFSLAELLKLHVISRFQQQMHTEYLGTRLRHSRFASV